MMELLHRYSGLTQRMIAARYGKRSRLEDPKLTPGLRDGKYLSQDLTLASGLEAALRPIRNSLEADGFDRKVDGVNDDVVSLVVLAGPEACLECLIPEEHFKLRVEDKLKGLARMVRLRYPETSQPAH